MKKIIFIKLMLLSFSFMTVNAANDDEELGCIRGDCISGQGTLAEMTDRGRRVYRGNFFKGKFQGIGRLTYTEDNEVYRGNWVNGKKHGRGSLWKRSDYTWDIYIGEWKNDRRNGLGIQVFNFDDWRENRYSENWLSENTENYRGEFKNDVFYGQGTYRWEDGSKFVGGWVANKKHGEGYFEQKGFKRHCVYEFDEISQESFNCRKNILGF